MRILVTGAAGYIGSVLCPQLSAQGFSVTALDLHALPDYFSDTSVEYVQGDTTDEVLMSSLIRRSDVIIPLAALVGAPLCDREPERAWAVNLGAIRSILKYKNPEQAVIFPMTNNGYVPEEKQILVTEDTPMRALSIYTQSKLQAETILLQAPKTISLRLASVFGISPRMRADLLAHHFVALAVQEGAIELYEETFKRNFVHIQDVVRAFIHALRHCDEMAGHSFNVASEACNISKQELALKIRERLSRLKIVLQEQSADPDQRNFFISTEKIKKTGFQTQKDFDQGLSELISYYQKRNQEILQ